MKPSLLILAAGMGSRYGGLKQLDAVGPSGETILDYSVHDALKAGFGKVVFVIRRDIEAEFRQVVGARYENIVEVEYVFQELDALPEGFEVPTERVKPWGTGHAILVARSVINEPFAVINADDFYGRDAYQQLANFLVQDGFGASNHAMVAYKLSHTLSEHGTVSRGVCQVDETGHLTAIEEVTAIEKTAQGAIAEKREFSGDERVSMNLWGFQPEVFALFENQFRAFLQESGSEVKSEFYITFAIDEQIHNGQATVSVLKTDSSWTGVTYREDKPTVEAFIRELVSRGEYPEALLK